MKNDITRTLTDLKAGNSRLRREATIILGKSFYRFDSCDRAIALKALFNSVGDSDEIVRFWFATLIKEIFFHASKLQRRTLVQALTKFINDADDRVRTTALETTCRILFEVESADLKLLIDAVLARVDDTSSAVRDLSVDNLKRACHVAGPKRRSVLDALNRLTCDSDYHVRESAIRIVDSLHQ